MNSFLRLKNDCTSLLRIHVSKCIAEKKTTCRLPQVFPFVPVALKSAFLKLELPGKKIPCNNYAVFRNYALYLLFSFLLG